ncbi:hypothetical protein T459_16137 [Capsicum annuum]|uniref:Pectinesterase inhibitor domain-containing protein n=1 Tax=Capsicum annuum TaxID=4072 RepID=A0A2G2Z892_CAPAN|nr:hypothetical protein T459_16137 [Capsicum annuum]
MCIKSKSPRFCLQVFGLNPHRRPYQLTREAINLALTNASDITKKIHTFIDQTEDFNLKDIYSYCLNYYQSVIDTLRSAEERLLNDGGYADVNDAGIIAQVNAFRCENEFQRELGYVYNSTLTKDNENLRIFGSILVSSINLLYNSTSVQKVLTLLTISKAVSPYDIIPPRRSNTHGKSSVLLEDNVDGTRPTYMVQTQSRVPSFVCIHGVPPVSYSSPLTDWVDDTPALVP